MAGIANFKGKKAAPFKKGGKRRAKLLAKDAIRKARQAKGKDLSNTGRTLDFGHPHPGQRFRHGWIPVDGNGNGSHAKVAEAVKKFGEGSPEHRAAKVALAKTGINQAARNRSGSQNPGMEGLAGARAAAHAKDAADRAEDAAKTREYQRYLVGAARNNPGMEGFTPVRQEKSEWANVPTERLRKLAHPSRGSAAEPYKAELKRRQEATPVAKSDPGSLTDKQLHGRIARLEVQKHRGVSSYDATHHEALKAESRKRSNEHAALLKLAANHRTKGK